VRGGPGGSTASEASVARTPGKARVVALVAARDEADRIGATVQALRGIRDVSRVVVVDDGSKDDTAVAALEAGATVLRRHRSGGKGSAIDAAFDRLDADVWLLADADLAESAGALAVVLAPVRAGDADVAIARLPAGRRDGGFGLVKRAARWAIRRLSGFDASEPLSGQRAVSSRAVHAMRPLAPGFGMETAMTIDAARAGLRVVEIAADVSHRATHRDVRGFAHRGRQGWDVMRAVVPRALRLR
jgi:glycosyltransferase involved in cell wall biosynthesis